MATERELAIAHAIERASGLDITRFVKVIADGHTPDIKWAIQNRLLNWAESIVLAERQLRTK